MPEALIPFFMLKRLLNITIMASFVPKEVSGSRTNIWNYYAVTAISIDA